jgi:oligopeptide transport system ATP-binding protein
MITHDLGVVAEMCDRVIVMYAGQEVETGSVDDIFKNPQHPYTKGLLKSVPKMNMNRNEQLVPIVGTPPDLFNPPEGCPFFARCDQAMEVCRKNDPELNIIEKSRLEGFNHCAACWLHHPLARAAAEKY